MELVIERRIFDNDYTIGDFKVNGKFLSNCLEDKVRLPFIKVKGKTAIPAGRYEVIVDMSSRFKRLMPHILNVPFFDGIRIHAGNTDKDTEGCILLGKHDCENNFINDSVTFNNVLMDILQRCVDRKERIWITIK